VALHHLPTARFDGGLVASGIYFGRPGGFRLALLGAAEPSVRWARRVNTEDYLYACVEAGVALSGFAALALAIRSRDEATHTPYERALVASLVERGLVAALLALMPLLLESFQLDQQTLWAACSGAFLLYGATIVFRGIRFRQLTEAEGFVERHIFIALFATGVLVLITQLFNIVSLGFEPGARWFLLGVTWLLFSAGYVFWFFLRAWVRSA